MSEAREPGDAPKVKQTHYRYSWPEAVKAVECLEQLGKSYDVRKRRSETQSITYEGARGLGWGFASVFTTPVTFRRSASVWLIEEHE